MTFLEKFKLARIRTRRGQEVFYAAAIREIESGVRRDGLWGRAVSQSGGQEGRAFAVYVKLVVDALKDDADLKALQKIREETRSDTVSPAATSSSKTGHPPYLICTCGAILHRGVRQCDNCGHNVP